MKKYGYKTFALGGILAGSLIAAPSVFAHGGKYLNSGDTSSSSSYSWNDETASPSDTYSSDNSGSFSSNEENPQFSNDSNPAPIPESDRTAMNDQLQQDQDKLNQDMSNGASNDQIAEDQRAIELDQQQMQDSVAFNGDGTVTVTPGS